MDEDEVIEIIEDLIELPIDIVGNLFDWMSGDE